MKAISIASIVLGGAALLLCGFDLFANGVLELLPLLVAGIAVLVGLVGLRVQKALMRLAAAESDIKAQQERSLSLSGFCIGALTFE